MPVRPTGFPGWASGPSGYIAEPTATTKALGWQAAQAPPASYMNWLHKLTYDWLNYLDQQTQDTVVINDDFVRAHADNFWSLGAGFTPQWNVSPSSFSFGAEAVGGMGVIDNTYSYLGVGGFSGVDYVNAGIDLIGNRDFRMEFIARAFVSSGANVQFGLFEARTSAHLLRMGFNSTGASSVWTFEYSQSGGVATIIGISGLNNNVMAASGLHRIAAERQGSTMFIEVDGNTVATVPAWVFSNESLLIGVKAVHPAVTNSYAAIDRIILKVRRTT